MAANQESRQTAIANELFDVAKELAHSTRTVPQPPDSYELLGALTATQRLLAQVYEQLAEWHGAVEDGVHYAGVDEPGVPSEHDTGPDAAAVHLHDAAARALTAEIALGLAQRANGVVRWKESPSP